MINPFPGLIMYKWMPAETPSKQVADINIYLF
jgi:hypothetical protein